MISNNQIAPFWKPVGLTSYDVIRKIKKSTKDKLKIGHCGTLDPFAEGIIVICTGDKLKEVSNLKKLKKTYYAEITFGSETDTLDCTGRVIKKSNNLKISYKQVQSTIKNFPKSYNQSPPYYSAKKINGVRLYKFARKDIFIKLKGSKINIIEINIINFNKNILTLSIECESGTYIRSIAKDIATNLNTYAHLTALKRIRIGDFVADDAIKI